MTQQRRGQEHEQRFGQPPFIVGANFPWVDCGHDFGPRPPGYGAAARDWQRVAQDLMELRSLGITVVRWWLLAGGVNYPVGRDVREVARPSRDRLGRIREWRPALGELAPGLPRAFLDDFARLCEACRRAGVQLLPSLLSFEFFGPYRERSGGGGRRSFCFGPGAGVQHEAIAAFLDATLSPLLETSLQHRDAIYAWELVNEPDWAVRGGAGRPRGLLSPIAQLVTRTQMSAFIEHGVRRIVEHDFTATIGFQHGRAPWLEPRTWMLLRQQAERGRYVHQHHHYPTSAGDYRLPAAGSLPVQPCLLGEFPTGRKLGLANMVWLDCLASERDPNTYLLGRWRAAQRAGYLGALAWSTQPDRLQQRTRERALAGGREPGRDARVQWGPAQREQTRRFVEEIQGSGPELPGPAEGSPR